MSSCFIGHILALITIYHNWFYVLSFLVTFLFLTINTALSYKAVMFLQKKKCNKPFIGHLTFHNHLQKSQELKTFRAF